MSEDLIIIMKWAGKEYPINVEQDADTVGTLRDKIFKLTNVQPARQKLINLKHQGKPPNDDLKLRQLNLKTNFKLMMVGSTEKAIENACISPEIVDDVEDDFDCTTPGIDLATFATPLFLERIERRVREYKITELNAPVEGKKLLVLDVDYTLFDHRSVAEHISELMRPHLHEFLEAVYPYYNLVIWSATGMRWIEQKMSMFGVPTNPNYKIWFYIDSLACISVNVEERIFDTKPLGVIWGKYPQYSAENTLLIDDIERNFVMNPQSGLKIKSFRSSVRVAGKDRELLKLSNYLVKIAKYCKNFKTLDHKNWQNYKPPPAE